MSDERTNEERREFLKGVLVGGGAAAVAIAGGGAMGAPEDEKRPAAQSDNRPKGYHVTPHIAEYYKTAQF
ncbi:MAG TPA: formate dehydrogenase [Burkholderiales bacterium]